MADDAHVPPGPGGLLRSARESAGISLRDISAQLHLDERTVDSLERDDFEHLPAPTFVRGYLRGYARLLSVPAGPVMEAYDREGFRPPDLVADISEEPERKATDFPVSLVTWAVGLVLIAMVIVWWNNTNQEFSDLLGPTDQSSPLTADGGATGQGESRDKSESSAQVRTGELASSSAAQRPTTSSGPATLSPQPPPRSPVQTPPSEATASAPTTTQAPSASSADAGDNTLRADKVLAQARAALTQSQQSIPSSSNASGAQTQATAASTGGSDNASQPDSAAGNSGAGQVSEDSKPSPASTASAGTRLQLKFANESWVEVVDRDKKKLFYNLAKAGKSLDLRGPGPLRVILGNTKGVEVRVNGKSFDVLPFISKGVARFTLP